MILLVDVEEQAWLLFACTLRLRVPSLAGCAKATSRHRLLASRKQHVLLRRKMCAMQAAWVPGMSLLVDYPFAAYPDNFGHWAELLLPIYNVIEEHMCSQGHAVALSRIDSLVMTNVRKQRLAVSRALSLQGSCHYVCLQGLNACLFCISTSMTGVIDG